MNISVVNEQRKVQFHICHFLRRPNTLAKLLLEESKVAINVALL